ncbi:hypothetical protein EJ357_00665 [Streptomyces cyaneochromogenes]|uniref:Uncharacterized protein n=1 Tax=Streptomyces cyaneochromogenes TaxID=2496836 RepID=A0A3S5HT56_9ACTN|nr:hypothetical protein [Streptomyces cyaneochromogenes]AZQ32171.1 hypothetical protein EJ357_00665 [Streptomyces cyaneochromogenes]
MMQTLASEIAMGTRPDPRGRDGYLREVELYLEVLRGALPQTLPEVAALAAPCVALRLHNNTHTHLKDVQVRLVMPDGMLALVPMDPEDRDRREPFLSGLLKAPRPYGPVNKFHIGPIAHPLLPYSFTAAAPSVVPSQWDIEVEETTVVFPAQDVRVGLSEDLALFVAVTERPMSGTLTMPWTATATNMDGTAQGTVSLPVAPERSLFALIADVDGTENEYQGED